NSSNFRFTASSSFNTTNNMQNSGGAISIVSNSVTLPVIQTNGGSLKLVFPNMAALHLGGGVSTAACPGCGGGTLSLIVTNGNLVLPGTEFDAGGFVLMASGNISGAPGDATYLNAAGGNRGILILGGVNTTTDPTSH